MAPSFSIQAARMVDGIYRIIPDQARMIVFLHAYVSLISEFSSCGTPYLFCSRKYNNTCIYYGKITGENNDHFGGCICQPATHFVDAWQRALNYENPIRRSIFCHFDPFPFDVKIERKK